MRKAFATYRGDGHFEHLVLGEISGVDLRIDAEGRWTVQNGVVNETVTKSTVAAAVGKSERSRIISFNPNQIVIVDEKNQRLVLNRSKVPKNLPRISPLMTEIVQAAALKKAYAVYTPQPKYPYSSFRNNREGPGLFRVVMSSDGNADRVEVVRSTGDGDLDEAAKTALRHWRFKPGKVKSIVTPVIFTMHGL